MTNKEIIESMLNDRYKKKKTKTEDIIKSMQTGTYQPSNVEEYLAPFRKSSRENIAPIKEEEERTWFKGGAFSDGYDFGDVTKTILGTTGDIVTGAVKGVGNLAEGVVDLGAYGVAGVKSLFGADTSSIKEFAQKEHVNDALAPVSDFFDRGSLLGDKADAIPEGLGYVGGILLTGGLGASAGLGATGVTALTTSTIGASAMGSGMSEAYKGGATDGEAVTYGLISGIAEAGTELIFGGLGKTLKATGLSHGLSSADDMLAKKISSKLSSQVAKNFAEFGVKAAAEGSEEVMAGVIQAIGKKVTYMEEEELLQILDDENLFEQFVAGAVTSGLAQSGYIPKMQQGSLREANKTGRDFITGYTQNEQSVVDKVVEKRVTEATKNGTKLTNKEINKITDEVQQDLERGLIDTSDIESVLGGETYTKLQNTKTEIETLQKEATELENKPNAEITVKERERLDEIRAKLDEISKADIETQFQKEMSQKIGKDRLLQLSYSKKAQADSTRQITEETQKQIIEKTKENIAKNDYKDKIEFVPIDEIENIKEFDRLGENKKATDTEIEALKNKIIEKGIENPLGVLYNPENGNMILSEGNTRLALAKELGLAEVPVIVTRAKDNSYFEGKKVNTTDKGLGDVDTDYMKFSDIYGKKIESPDIKDSLSDGKVQGLEDYSRDEIKEITNDYIKETLEGNGLYDVTIIDSAIHGSRGRGTAKTDSDLDIVVEYDGDIREDSLFDILNEEPMYIDGVKVDINPINKNKSGTLKEYMERSDAYDKEILAKQVETSQKGTRGEDVRLQEAIAPIQETINNLSEQLTRIEERITSREDYAPINEANLPELEQQYTDSFNAIDDNLAPVEQEIDNVETEPNAPTKGLLETRDYAEVGNRKVKAYQYEHPEVRPYFQEAAEGMLYDLENSIKGERNFNDQLYYDTNGEQGFYGTTRHTAEDIAELLDGIDGKYKLSYKDIRKGLEAIIEDHGAENNAASKRIEMYLDKRLREGYTDVGSGAFIPPNQEYLSVLEGIEYNNYYSNLPIDESVIPEKILYDENVIPIAEEVPTFEGIATQRRIDFDNQVLTDKPVSELEKKKARELKKLGSKEDYIKNKVTEFYQETKRLTKGVRASHDLSRVLDVAFKDIDKITEGMTEEDAKAEKNRIWRDVTNSFMNIKAKPFETVNPNSTIEATIRQEIDRQYNNKVQKIDNMKEITPKKAVHEAQRELARNLIGDTSTWVDKKMGVQYQVNTLKRNLRDIVRDASGKQDIQRADAIYEEYQGKYNKNEAKLKEEFNRLAEPFRELRLTRAEETYVQMLGEFRYNPETTLTQEVVEEFYETNKAKIDTDIVEEAIENARKTYDELFERINETLRNQGLKELEYRKGYFPHFVEEKQGFLAKLLDWKIRNDQIPTDIAGLTELNNPERSWQSFNKHRESDTTDYNFSKGFDTYVHGALDWIYHIEDIQKRRALENEIRYQHSEKGVREKIDAIYNNTELDADEKQAQIEAVYGVARTPLNNFVTDLRTGTNKLAGKKSSLDRGLEQSTNRQIYSTMTNISNRVSGNMIVGSVSSALTNFIPITQSWLEVSPISSLNAARETISNAIKDDGTIAKSTFLTNRMVRADNLYKSNWDKASEKVAIMTDVIDSFTSQVIWRAKYNENIKNGMSEIEAINNADIFAENVIAGRSRGNEPTIFHSKNPLTKMFTAFQLEVNNQYQYMFKDAPVDIGSKGKLIKGYATAFVGAYVYNALYSALVGRDVAFDPIGLIEGILKELGFGDDDEEEEKTASEKFTAIAEDLVQQVPFVGGLFGGGRVPLSAAIPYENPVAMVTKTGAGVLDALSEEEKREKALKDLTSEWLKPVTYLALPFGGGQISKTIKGVSMYDEDLPVAGSYTNAGDLRFTADESATGKLKSAIFGQWASKSAQEYVDSGFKTVKKDDIDELVALDMTSTEYRKYRKGLKDAGNTYEEKIDYINSLDVPIAHKNIMANNVLDRDYQVDMKGYTDYEEFDFSYKNPEKYEFLKANNITYSQYTASEENKKAYDWAYNNPEKYVLSKAITDDVVTYKKYKKDLDELKNIEDENGKVLVKAQQRKLEYINNLDIDGGARSILYKSIYETYDADNNYIIEYLDSRDDISYEDMVTILTELGMKVEGNRIWWD